MRSGGKRSGRSRTGRFGGNAASGPAAGGVARISFVLSLGVASSIFAAGGFARAEIYKYKKPSGAIVYTDNLSQLPPDRREYYFKLKEEREARRRELERRVGKDELVRREAEEKRVEDERQALADRERAERIAAMDAEIQALRKRNRGEHSERATWKRRMQEAETRMRRLLADFQDVSDRYNTIAIKPSFTYLPGEQEELERLRAQMENLERSVDAAIEEVEVTIPETARKNGVPPGWLR